MLGTGMTLEADNNIFTIKYLLDILLEIIFHISKLALSHKRAIFAESTYTKRLKIWQTKLRP